MALQLGVWPCPAGAWSSPSLLTPRGTAGPWFRPSVRAPALASTRLAHASRVIPRASNGDGSQDVRRPSFLSSIVRPLRDFGLGKRSLIQGSVGLFVISGIGFAFMLVVWAHGGMLGRRGQGYQAVIEFPVACGISVGTPVRIRGVPVGGVLGVQPSLERVDVLVEIRDASTVIPRNSLVEANQSGLIAEPLVDITPQLPVPAYTANPLDEECEAEGQVVCHRGRIRGVRGVAMDDLVHICTKIAHQMDDAGLERVFAAVDAATAALEGARPLLRQAVALTDQLMPLLEEIRQGGLLGNVEALTAIAADAAAEIQRLQVEVLTDGNVRALRDAVQTLTRTLSHIERVVDDFGGLTGDRRVIGNLKQFIEALSRLVAD